jgi:hypothetical protein
MHQTNVQADEFIDVFQPVRSRDGAHNAAWINGQMRPISR